MKTPADVKRNKGLIEARVRRQNGRVVSVYENDAQGFDDNDGTEPFSTVCEDHGSIISHRTVTLARLWAAEPNTWCEVCQEENKVSDDGEVIVERVQIPGIAWTRIIDGDYANEEKERWDRLVACSRNRPYGAGYARIVEGARADDLADLYEYVHGVAGAAWAALGDQLGDPDSYHSVRAEAMACTLASDRIKEVLRIVGVDAKDRFD